MAERKNDYGKKIPLSRKDVWDYRHAAIDWNDPADVKRVKLMKKSDVWKYGLEEQRQLAAEKGTRIAYFAKKVYDSLPKRLGEVMTRNEDLRQAYETYVDYIITLRDRALEIDDDQGIVDFRSCLEDYMEKDASGRMRPDRDHLRYKIWSANSRLAFSMDGDDTARRDATPVSYLDYMAKREMFLMGRNDQEWVRHGCAFDASSITGTERRETEEGTMTSVSFMGMNYASGSIEKGSIVIDGSYTKEDFGDGLAVFIKRYRPESIFAMNVQRGAEKEKFCSMLKDDRRSRQVEMEGLRNTKRETKWEWRHGRNVTPEDFVRDFGFRGINFGNTVPLGERQHTLNVAYDSLMDMARALEIRPQDISLDGRLSLSFGGRGLGGKSAIAHYEPESKAINITRKRGGGAFAHEWIHALDHLAGEKEGGRDEFMSDIYIPSPMRDFMNYHRKNQTRYWKASSLAGTKYWGSPIEMLARAGSCWVDDRIGADGTISQWAAGASEMVNSINGPLYPTGDERKKSDEILDGMLDWAKEKGLVVQHDYELAKHMKREPKEGARQKESEISLEDLWAKGSIATDRRRPARKAKEKPLSDSSEMTIEDFLK